MKHGEKITIYDQSGPKRLQLDREYFQHGIRYYDMLNQDRPAEPAKPYHAEYIDRFFDHQKEAIHPKGHKGTGRQSKARKSGAFR